MAQIYRDAAKIAVFLEGWLADALAASGAKGAALGLSGGVDSAALAAILRRVCAKDELLAVIMPAYSMPADEEHARLAADALDISAVKVDLSSIFDHCVKAMEACGGELSPLARANIKPRLRMATLYALAQSRNFLVCGGGNKDELAFGYFTKHGDSGVDLLPFGDLLKGEVRALARYLGVPDAIVDKPPSAGLWEGQTDEAEMGVSYADLDLYLAGGETTPAVREKIESAARRSEHKRNMPRIAVIPTQAAGASMR